MSELTDRELRLEALKMATSTWTITGMDKSIVEYAEEIYQFLKNGLQPTIGLKDE